MYKFFQNQPWGRVFHNINLSNLGNILQRNIRIDGVRESIFRVSRGTNFEIYLDIYHGDIFVDSMSYQSTQKDAGYAIAMCAYSKYQYVTKLTLLKHLYLNNSFVFLAIPCWLKALGICPQGFWIRADFPHKVSWCERHPNCKISLVNLHSELKGPAFYIK